jgi:hypothetical protein
MVGLLFAAGTVVWRSKRAPRNSPKATEATVTTVTWHIDSEPSGAEIFRDDGEVVGATPWSRTEPPHDGLLRLHLRLPQHRDSIVLINQSQNSDQKVLLEREIKSEGAAPITAGNHQPQQRLRWTVASQPPGAEVILADDEQVLGKTPWTFEQGADAGILKLFLQLPGYVRTSVLLDLSAGSQQTIILQRSGEKPRPAKPAATGPRPTGSRDPDRFSPVY